MSGPLRIVKVGGSLLALPDLGPRLRRWLSEQPAGVNVLLAGGGTLADEVRRWDQQLELGEEAAHWLCVDLLDLTAQLLRHLLPEAQLCRSLASLSAAIAPSPPHPLVFLPAGFLREEEAQLIADRLPCSWDVTSDSIAARLADVMHAGELVLLKSALPESFANLQELSGGYVDRQFAQAACNVAKVRFVNLRDSAFAEVVAES